MEGLRSICDEHGILLIADEIQSGMGRTGKWWAIEHTGVEPDILTTAKGIASGMPIGAFIARDSVWTWPPGAHGSTFAGNPVCAAAGLATLEIIESEGIANAEAMGARLRAGLEQASRDVAVIRDIRGVGLMLGVEFDSHATAEAVQAAAFERGLLTLECGESSLRFSPPLIVDQAAVDAAIGIFAEALASIPDQENATAVTGG
jgi:4-aminobutyrate aminotransferase